MNFKPFSHALVLKALKLERPFSIDELGENDTDPEELLDESGLFFCNYDNCGTKTYISKKSFFECSQFTVHFTAEEIKKGILLAPLRFVPFTADECELVINGKEVKKLQKAPGLKCLEEVYHLDHGQHLIKYLNESSDKTLLNLNSLQKEKLTVYDFSSYELQAGDHLHIILRKGRLEAKIFHSEDIDIQKAQNWCVQFEKSLLGVLREFGPFYEFSTQIELAYFYGAESLRKQGPIALRDFLSLSKKIKLVDFIFQKIIWYSDQDPVKSAEAQRKLSSMRECFGEKTVVCPSFYSLLSDDLQKAFVVLSPFDAAQMVESKASSQKLSKAARRTALWIINNRALFQDEDMPEAELLMFEAAFNEFQFLCTFYMDNKDDRDFEENFLEALELNFEIFTELMAFLTEYFHSI